jgi:hypothetical protein
MGSGCSPSPENHSKDDVVDASKLDPSTFEIDNHSNLEYIVSPDGVNPRRGGTGAADTPQGRFQLYVRDQYRQHIERELSKDEVNKQITSSVLFC